LKRKGSGGGGLKSGEVKSGEVEPGEIKPGEIKPGEIKRMWVAPDARGLGIAQRLLDAIEAQAVSMGLDTLQLDTNRALTEAHALYTRNGYREIPRYNDNPYADHWFEKRELKSIAPDR
jgi:GNAT superfamily N-acetyltransferase